MGGERKAKCPACGEYFEVDEGLEMGIITCCSECYTDLKVTKLKPLQVVEIEDSSDSDFDDEEDEEGY